jgi:murein DD-endopeptidase MepM/ murein hydrolase activator NlpD
MEKPLEIMKIRPMQFGRYDPLSNTIGNIRNHGKRRHDGWDLVAPPGTPVFAIADGETKFGYMNGYGKYISLKFEYQGMKYFAFYAHLSEVLAGNMSVKAGTEIAKTGHSGAPKNMPSNEDHLHFEIRTIETPAAGIGCIDPGQILGYGILSCSADDQGYFGFEHLTRNEAKNSSTSIHRNH